MIIDEIRGRITYASINKDLNKRAKKRIFGIPKLGSNRVFKDLDHKSVQIYVTSEMESRLARAQWRIEKKLNGVDSSNSNMMYTRLIKLMRQRVALIDRQIQFFDEVPSHKSMFLNDYNDLILMRTELLSNLELFDH